MRPKAFLCRQIIRIQDTTVLSVRMCLNTSPLSNRQISHYRITFSRQWISLIPHTLGESEKRRGKKKKEKLDRESKDVVLFKIEQ